MNHHHKKTDITNRWLRIAARATTNQLAELDAWLDDVEQQLFQEVLA